MKFTIPARELDHALDGMLRVLPRRTRLPILNGIDARVEEDRVVLRATDLDTSAAYACRDAQVHEGGRCLFADARRLRRLVRHARNDEVHVRTLDDKSCEVVLDGPKGQRVHTLATADTGDWPADPPGIATTAVDPGLLANYRALLVFASTDSTRGAIQGVRCDVDGKSHRMVATDGRRLSVRNGIRFPFSRSTTIPPDRLLCWPALKCHDNASAGINDDGNLLRITCGPWDIHLRCIDEAYPDWRQVIPADVNQPCLVIDKSDIPALKEAVRTLPGADSQYRPVALLPGRGNAVIAGHDSETGTWSRIELPRSPWRGESRGITVDRCYLLDAVEAGFLRFDISEACSPIVSREEHGLHVLMPVNNHRAAIPEDTADEQKQEQERDDEQTQPREPAVARERDRTMINDKRQGNGTGENSDLQGCYQDVRQAARELNSAISRLGQAIRETVRDGKAVRSELGNARDVLAKLQGIRL